MNRRLLGPGAVGPSVALGAAGAWAVVSHWHLPGEPLSLGEWAGLLGGTLVLAGLLLRWGLPFGVRALSAFSGRGRVAWVLGCAVLAMLLLRAVVLHAPKPRVDGELTLIATGQQNPAAQGTELWLLETRQSDGSVVPASEWELLGGGWELRERRSWVSYQQQPARLRWRGKVTGPLSLTLVAHHFSGILRYEWNGEAQEVDLYTPTDSKRTLVLPVDRIPKTRGMRAESLLFHTVHGVSLATVLLLLGLWLVSREGARTWTPVRSGVREGLVYAVPSLVSGLVWLSMVFPGMMTSDSTDQWEQAIVGEFIDSHPVFHTFLLRMLMRLWASPAVVSLTQILVFSALVGWGCVTLRRAGQSRAVAGGTALLLGLAPVDGAHLVTLWKDVAFSLAFLALSIVLFRAAVDREELARRRLWVELVGLSCLLMLLRHNGPAAVFGGFLGLLCLEVRRWKALASGLVLTLILVTGVRAVLFRAYKAQSFEGSMALIGYIGAHVARDTPLSAEQRALLEELHPLDDRWNYNCFTNVPTVFDGRFRMEALGRHKAEIMPLFIDLTRRAPGTTLKHLECASSLLWKVFRGEDPVNRAPIWGDNAGKLQTLIPNSLSLSTRPLVPERLSQRFLKAVVRTSSPDLEWFFWSPALALYLSVLSCAVACVRQRSGRQAVVLLPLALHSVALALLVPSQDLRYQLPVIFVALLFTLAWLVPPRAPEPLAGST